MKKHATKIEMIHRRKMYISLRKEGWTIPRIAREYGITHQAVMETVKKMPEYNELFKRKPSLKVTIHCKMCGNQRLIYPWYVLEQGNYCSWSCFQKRPKRTIEQIRQYQKDFYHKSPKRRKSMKDSQKKWRNKIRAENGVAWARHKERCKIASSKYYQKNKSHLQNGKNK